jgi:hypothetical protein
MINLTPYRLHFTATGMADALTFASWAFGPTGLPNLEMFVFGPAETKEWYTVLGECIVLTRNEDLMTRGMWPYRQVRVEDEALRARFEENWDFVVSIKYTCDVFSKGFIIADTEFMW